MKQQVLPQWLQENSPTQLPEYTSTWQRTDYLERTLRRIYELLSEDAYVANVSRQEGLLQQLEPHVKLLGILILILATAWTKRIDFLVGMNVLLLGVAIYAGLEAKAFFVRVWLPTFLFSGIAVLPGIMNWVTPGESLYIVYTGLQWKLGWLTLPAELSITKQGLQSAFFVTLRSAASLGLTSILVKTTRWPVLTKALAKFGLPSTMIAVLDLTYRYMYLFLLVLLEYIMGRKSRAMGTESQVDKFTWIGRTISGFLRMTREYSRDIYSAMLSRGYSGEYYVQQTMAIASRDICFLFIVGILCYFAWGGILNVRLFRI
jgi:cobalt/nickel transport system permease protein